MTSSSTKALLKVLTTPSKVASALDWKKAVGGSIMSINIHKDSIGLAIASHPSHDGGDGTSTATTIESIPLPNNRGKVDSTCRERLSQIVNDHNVCGFVVSFPLQKDTGRMGAACGRVLHSLDNLLTMDHVDDNTTNNNNNNNNNNKNATAGAIFTSKRPLCLWDCLHSKPKYQEDVWGRSPIYARTSLKKLHVASREQYDQHDDSRIVAAKVWDDFVRVNWPDLVYEETANMAAAATSSSATSRRPGPAAVSNSLAEPAAVSNSLAEQWLDDNAAEYANLAVV